METIRQLNTTHQLVIGDARTQIPPGPVQLVVTSPPYPMIEMWDELFGSLSYRFGNALAIGAGHAAFQAAHEELNVVWSACAQRLQPGGFFCVNIGDATRSINEQFALYSNAAQIITNLTRWGLTQLPGIIWRKPSNAPNKFMGSGTLPAGAYVTHEHEHILIFRKGENRAFSPEDRVRRRASAFFWEERNLWFSDLWTDIKGTSQVGATRRTGAFPFELPYRLITMYSLQGDTVLDPFAGTGTTMAAALACGRNSIGVELSEDMEPVIQATLGQALQKGVNRVKERLAAHVAFTVDRQLAHTSSVYGFPVMTKMEVDLNLWEPNSLRYVDGCTVCTGTGTVVSSSLSETP